MIYHKNKFYLNYNRTMNRSEYPIQKEMPLPFHNISRPMNRSKTPNQKVMPLSSLYHYHQRLLNRSK